MEFFVGSWSSMIYHWLFWIQYQWFLTTCDAFSEVVYEFEGRVTYFGSMRAKLILWPLGMPQWVWPSMNRQTMLFVHTSTLPPRMHSKLTEHGKCLQNNQLPNKSRAELRITLIWTLLVLVHKKNALRNPTDFCCELGLLLLRAPATSDLSRRMKFKCATWR